MAKASFGSLLPPMKIPAPSLYLALTLLACLPIAVAQDAPPTKPAPEPFSLETFPEKLQKVDDEVVRKLDEVRTVVDTEAAAKRISEPVAQSLRWSLRTTATAGPVVDVRSVVGTMRVPTDNATLTQAVKELETAYTVAQSQRAALASDATREIRRRVTEVIRTATKPAEIEALQREVAAAGEVQRRRSGTGTSEITTVITGAEQILRGLRRLIDAQTDGKLDALSGAIGSLRSEYRFDRDAAYESEIQARFERVMQPFVQAAEKAENDTAAAIIARKPAAEVQVAIARLEESAEQLAQLRSNQSGYGQRDLRSVAASYRNIVQALSNKGGDEYSTEGLNSARSAARQLGAKRAAEFEVFFAKLEAESAEVATKMAAERGEKLRERIAGAKQPADLDAISADLRRWSSAASRSGTGDRENWNQLASKLSTLSAAWATASPALLQPDRYGDSERATAGAFASELAALRKRVERDVLSRALQAPELNTPPLAEQTPEAALNSLCDQLVAKEEWRRLYDVLSAQAAMQSAVGGRSENDALTALRAYFTAQNLELAEQWADAAQNYKTVLRCVSPRAPIKPAAERIKALAKAHPEAFPQPASAPQPGIPRQ